MYNSFYQSKIIFSIMTFVAVSKFKNVCGNLIHGYFGPFHAEVVFGLWPDFFIKIHSNMMLRGFCVLQFKHCLFVVRSEVRALCVHLACPYEDYISSSVWVILKKPNIPQTLLAWCFDWTCLCKDARKEKNIGQYSHWWAFLGLIPCTVALCLLSMK